MLNDQQQKLQECPPELLLAWHWLGAQPGDGFDRFFSWLRASPRPSEAQAREAIAVRLEKGVCRTETERILANILPVDTEQQDWPQAAEERAHYAGDDGGWPLAYALAWLSVSGDNSAMPPWVRHRFPEAARLVRCLRDAPCGESDCDWCREQHDATRELRRWFNLDGFRPHPVDEKSGQPMQQAITEATMRREPVLGILPTGTGKSLCYQVPALSRHYKTGALTVVISPLLALMEDQVAGLEKRGIDSCVTINSLLSLPERAKARERVRLGDASMLLIPPEQLRNPTTCKVLEQREIGTWVLDEAHCLSQWGQDFRPDYRYVARFIRKREQETREAAPVLCLTATAKPEVISDICKQMQEHLGIELRVFNGGARRDNLRFRVISTPDSDESSYVHTVIASCLRMQESGSVITYCSTRRHTEEIAEDLTNRGIPADYFHGGLTPENKKEVQQRFMDGTRRVIVATNAFGMGIDKPDVRMVVHADIPGTLENYLQEAGRAGRDGEPARCILFYTKDDVERQFGLLRQSQLDQREIQSVLKSLRHLRRKKHGNGPLVATPGEILHADEDRDFGRDHLTDDTRVRTAIAWLERAKLLKQEENHTEIFPACLRVNSVSEAEARLEAAITDNRYRRQLLEIIKILVEADPDQGISTDELAGATKLGTKGVRSALHELERLGLSSNDTVLTAFVHKGVKNHSGLRFERATALEQALIAQLREAAPDLGKDETSLLQLRAANQQLRDAGHEHTEPRLLLRLLRSLAQDGQSTEASNKGGSLKVRARGAETVKLTLLRSWQTLEKTAELRRTGAERLLEHLLSCAGERRGTDLLAETTMGQLEGVIRSDLMLRDLQHPDTLLERALLWLHEQEIIRLNKGLAVFRQAMTIRLGKAGGAFTSSDYEPLRQHYENRVQQVHIIRQYAERGLKDMREAQRLARDYFVQNSKEFRQHWLPRQDTEISRQTTPESWRKIVTELKNPEQQDIVTDMREQTSVLVLAGPGSGKTRVLVHRIAFLLRARRERPGSILALAYNRHAAVEIRQRLRELVDDDAQGVMVLTCHGVAMRLTGASFRARAEHSEAKRPDGDDFRDILRNATALLRGDGLPPEEDADEQREHLLGGFRWILVDEYQDIGRDEYELISALAGRTLPNADNKLTLFAVGDDDQNIYSFKGASVEFIRRFEKDYKAKARYLTGNYRSTRHIIAAANKLIAPARERMKAEHPIEIDQTRTGEPEGGVWEDRDSTGRGRVQLLPAGETSITQAQAVMAELQRLSRLAPEWNWTECAVLAREWKALDPVRAFCELHDIPVHTHKEDPPPFWRLRETQALETWLHTRKHAHKLVSRKDLEGWVHERMNEQPQNPWLALLQEAVAAHALEAGNEPSPVGHFIEWLAEWRWKTQPRPHGLLLSSTHGAKGLEFDRVTVLDGGWERRRANEDLDASRRLYYVAMTRARQTLTLAYRKKPNELQGALLDTPSVLPRRFGELPPAPPELRRRYQQLGPKDVDLGFAGRHQDNHPVHKAIQALAPSDTLQVRQGRKSWELLDGNGDAVGRIAKGFTPSGELARCSATVSAIITWRRKDSELQYQDGIRCDEWEVVVPELVFMP